MQQRSLASCNFLWLSPSSTAPSALTPNRAVWQNMATKLDLLSPLSHTSSSPSSSLSLPLSNKELSAGADRGIKQRNRQEKHHSNHSIVTAVAAIEWLGNYHANHTGVKADRAPAGGAGVEGKWTCGVLTGVISVVFSTPEIIQSEKGYVL